MYLRYVMVGLQNVDGLCCVWGTSRRSEHNNWASSIVSLAVSEMNTRNTIWAYRHLHCAMLPTMSSRFPTLPFLSSCSLFTLLSVFVLFCLVCGSKTCFGFSDCEPGLLLVFPGLGRFCVSLIRFRPSEILLSWPWAWSLPVFGHVQS